MEEYKRDSEVAAQIKARAGNIDDQTSRVSMETAMRSHQDACEAEFKRNALEYRDSVQAEPRRKPPNYKQ